MTRSMRSFEKAACARIAPRFVPFTPIARAILTRSLGGFGSKPRAPLTLFL